MIKTLLPLVILIFVWSVPAQDEGEPLKMPTKADYPALVETAKTCEGFVPTGWKVVETATGDLNADGFADCVGVFQGTGSRFIYRNEGLGSDTFDTNPRILAVPFDNRNWGYKRRRKR